MKHLYFILIVSTFLACKSSYEVSEVIYSQQKFDSTYLVSDPEIENLITPYRTTLEASMNEILVEAAKNLNKAKPESTLGNLLADATLVIAQKYTKQKVDLAIINYGGIRVPSINKGPVTLGNVYELMPFDNYLVTLEIDGASLAVVCNQIASSGGWPISGITFAVEEGKAMDILIQGLALEKNKIYTLAISDYLANGGDHLEILKSFEQSNTNVLLRDAFIEYFTSVAVKNQLLDANLENRIEVRK